MKKPRKHSLRIKRSKKVGLPPGSLVQVAEIKPAAPTVVTAYEYDAAKISERTLTVEELAALTPPPEGKKLWLNVHGVHDAELIKKIGHAFNLHPLVLEDIFNTYQRPKADAYDDHLFIVARCFYYDPAQLEITSEQVSLVLGSNFLLTFQERATGSFDPVRERLRADRSRMRELGTDYLAYAFLDVVVDRYFIVLEQMGDDAELLEDELLSRPTTALLHKLHQLKRCSLELRRAVWPLREVVNELARNDEDFFTAVTLPYLRDVYDHSVHVIESLDAIRDLLGGMMDIYLSSISNRVNMEVRALTVVAMLFMPATLIAGIFGMNFEKMPWLHHPDGFWFALGIMGGIAAIMILIFWRRQWLQSFKL
jgi:magnesium transporter